MAVNQGSDQDHKDDNKKPVLNKYNSTDKYPTTLNQDFDRNLTIEKAKFEAQSSGSAAMHTPPSSISTPLPPIPAHSEDDAKPTIPQLTTSVTLPVVGNASINTNPSQSTPLAASKAKSKNEVITIIKLGVIFFFFFLSSFNNKEGNSILLCLLHRSVSQ
jgi:hypothetical protein